MHIAIVYPGKIDSAWCVSDGLVRTIRSMGHKVEDLHQGRHNSRVPNTESLSKCDLVIISGPEHLFNPASDKAELNKITCPKFAIYHESMIRQDRTFPFNELVDYFDQNFFPAIQDAEMMERKARARCQWLPFGVDTEWFHPRQCRRCKGKGHVEGIICGCSGGFSDEDRDVPVGFIGMVYAKRKTFLEQFQRVYTNPTPVLIGNVAVQDIEGTHPLHSCQRLAMNYSRILIFLNLPSLSQLMVTKVYETMACGCCLLTPWLEGQAERNMKGFDHGEHLIFYKPNPEALANLINNLLNEPERATKIGHKAWEFIRQKHSLRQRMEVVLSKVMRPQLATP